MKRVALLFVATTIALIVVGATHPVTAQLNQPLETSNPLKLDSIKV